MTELFGFSLDSIARALLILSVALLLLLALLGVSRPILLRIALRQMVRRRVQLLLVVCGLSLGASIITSVFFTGDTVQTAIHLQVVDGLGRVDEILHDARSPYVSGDVDISSFTGLNTTSPAQAMQVAFLDGLSGRLVTQREAPPQVYFPASVTSGLQKLLAHSSVIRALVGAAVEQHALLIDDTSRQIRGEVKVLGLPKTVPPAFGDLRSISGTVIHLAQFAHGGVAINAAAAADLGARPGDQLLLFMRQRRFRLRLAAIVKNGGLAGATPQVLLPLVQMQAMTAEHNAIDRVLVVNRGADDAAAAANSAAATNELYSVAPSNLRVDEAKAEGLRAAAQAEEIFTRIFTLFALFATGVGLLLVFLIFSILAADRRPEMGIGRVVGITRGNLVVMYLFEGTVYAIVAAGLGVALGLGIGAAIIAVLNRILDNYGFTLTFVVHHRVVILAYGLSLLATWLTVGIACWWVTRLTITSAIRDLPEPTEGAPGPWRLLQHSFWRLRGVVRTSRRAYLALSLVRWLTADVPLTVLTIAIALCAAGPGLLILGGLTMAGSRAPDQTAAFAIGITVACIGVAFSMRTLLRMLRLPPYRADRLAFTLGGMLLVAYWSLPVSAPTLVGLPPLQTGIEIFFLAGVAMVLGAVWMVLFNLAAALRPAIGLGGLPGRVTAAVRTAAAYTLHRQARAGLILAMFALVSFTLTVMAVVTNALQRSYGNVQAQTGGFDIRGDFLFADPITHLKHALQHSQYVNAHAFTFAGSQGYVPVGVIQLSAPRPSWRLTYADVLDGDFLHGTTFHLLYRAHGFPSDTAVWAALRRHPDLALLGSDLLPGGGDAGLLPRGTDIPLPFTLSHTIGPGFAPMQLWMADPRGGRAIKLRIIGVVNNNDGQHGGLIVPATALASGGIPPILPTLYFRVRPGNNVTQEARAIGSAFLDHGLQTTVLVSAVWFQNGPKILLARLLQGFVGLVLVLGIAGLAAAALRSVVERRQQIGMMRALGMPRSVIRVALLLESSLVALAGLGIGVTLGLLLARNLFLADFFEQYQTGLTMRVPWSELGLMVSATYLVALTATAIPAVLAGRIPPAEALLDR